MPNHLDWKNRSRHTNYYQVLSELDVDDEPCAHDEISLDQKAIRRCKRADRHYANFNEQIRGYYSERNSRYVPPKDKRTPLHRARDNLRASSEIAIPIPKCTKNQMSVQNERIVRTDKGTYAIRRIDETTATTPAKSPAKNTSFGTTLSSMFSAAEKKSQSSMDLELIMKLLKMVPNDLQTGATMLVDLYVCFSQLLYSTSFGDFCQKLYMSIRVMWRDASINLVSSLWKQLESMYTLMGVQDEKDKASPSMWRQVSDQIGKFGDSIDTIKVCPSMNILLDLIGIVSFFGLIGEKAQNFLKAPGWEYFHKRITESVTSWPDLFSVVLNVFRMAADAVATYFEDGTIDFFGWKYGKRRDLFEEYSHLVNESNDAIHRRMDDENRPDTCRYKSLEAFDKALSRSIDALSVLIKKGPTLEKNTYNRMYGELIRIRGEMTEFHRSSSARVKPYTFCVCGVTSSMKSTVTQAVWRQIAASNGISTAMTNQCTVNFKDEYFSEVKAQEILVMDDFMNGKPGVVKEGVSPIRILLDWSSNVAVQLPGAAIEDKGKRFCNAKVLGLTCHSKEFHAETYSYQPEAAYRRVEIFIEVHLRPEFRAPNGQPDYEKIPSVCFPDVWDFVLYTVTINGKDWEFARVGGPQKCFNNQELMLYLAEDSRKHFQRQRMLTERINGAEWICCHNCVKDACILCNPITPPRVPCEEANQVTEEAVRLIIADTFPALGTKFWKKLLDETRTLVMSFPNVTWVEEYYAEYKALHEELAFNGEFDALDAEFGTRLENYQPPTATVEDVFSDKSISSTIADVGEPSFDDAPTIHDIIFVQKDQEVLRIRESLDKLCKSTIDTPWKMNLRMSLMDKLRDRLRTLQEPAHTKARTESDGDIQIPLLPLSHPDDDIRVNLTPSPVEDSAEEAPPTETEGSDLDLDSVYEPPPASWFYNTEVQDTGLQQQHVVYEEPREEPDVRVDVFRVSPMRTLFITAIANATEPQTENFVRHVAIWGMQRDIRTALEVTVFEDAIIIYANHEELPLERFHNMNVQDDPKVGSTQWVRREKEVLASGTATGFLHKYLIEWVLDSMQHERTNWKLTACLTIFNGLGFMKVVLFNILLGTLCSSGFVGFLFTAFTHWKTRGVNGLAHLFVSYCANCVVQFGKRAWKIDEYMEQWSNGIVPAATRREWYLKQNPHLRTSLSQQVMLRWRTPTLFDVAFGSYKKPAMFVTKIVALATAATALYTLWRELSYARPVTIVPGEARDWELLLIDDKEATKPTPVTSPEVMEAKSEAVPAITLTADELAKQQQGTIKPLEGEQKDCWVRLAPPVIAVSGKAATTTPSDFRAKVKKNLSYCVLTYTLGEKEIVTRSHALCVNGSDWMIPKHSLKADVDQYHFSSTEVRGVIDNKCVGTFCKKDVADIGDTDFVLVRIRGSSIRGSVVDYFPDAEIPGVYASLMHIEDETHKETDCRKMPRSHEQEVVQNGQPYRKMRIVAQSKYPVKTKQGMCTAPWLGNPSSKPFFHSFHICGHAGTVIGGSQVVLKPWVLAAIAVLDAQTRSRSVSAEQFNPALYTGITVHTTVSERHPICFTAPADLPAVASIIGSHDGHSGKYSQDIRPTAIADGLTKRLGWDQVYKPVPNLNSTHHLHKGLSEILHPRTTLDAHFLEQATEDLREHIVSYVREIPYLPDAVKPLCDIVTVSGQDGVVGVDKINPSTSAGFPERGAKGRFYVPVKEFPGVSMPFTLDQPHLQTIAEMEEILASGRRIYAPFTLSVKVEPVKMHKDYARLFGASNMCFTFLFRKYFLSIFRLIQLNPYRFGTALGINCHSEDWDQLAQMMQWKDRIIEGDYETYDKTMSPAIIMKVFSILIEIAEMAGYDARAISIMHGLAHEVCYPVYEARGLLFVAGGSNPSGHPGTFVINSLVCSLYARYCFFREKSKRHIDDLRPFNYFVREITAGDDHLFSVSPECTWFDQHVMQANLADAHVGYTDGKKNKVIPEAFISLDTASFVSRGFRYCDYLKRIVAPLAIKSLKKSYMIHNLPKKPPVPPNELIATIVEQNLAELFFHGKEQFDIMDRAVRESMIEAGLGQLLPPPCSWEEVGDLIKERTIPSFQVDLRSKIRLRPEFIPGVVDVIHDNPLAMEITDTS